ncbi:hypothetical protein F4827_007053 [Paraburkholderia bannensis]|uniref:Uncharacterized protein n=1 Tax=Paraburkholderia bannensis TaxID=765414 RepID=A0A7W9WX02_9BURK|nr:MULTISPECIES: hypothetical protein [Paraburkholderia]MBB3262198.1 hypothetical protein [Paraburkholderia sp. WP4_3_2]MBB6107171.1 hypothetical protein [Paraburkholderia bannensis]
MDRVRKSRFFISECPSEPVFVLDGIASEWLFASGFWTRINRLMGTMYDQYEEDEAAPANLDQIAAQMCCEIRELEAREEEMIRFRCGWFSTGEAHTLETPRATLVAQLVSLQSFLERMAASGTTLELSL